MQKKKKNQNKQNKTKQKQNGQNVTYRVFVVYGTEMQTYGTSFVPQNHLLHQVMLLL